MEKVAQWKNGVQSRGIAAADAYEHLEEIRSKNDGALTDDIVLESARNPSSPIHHWFDWDDNRAAQEYRRAQARKLIRSIEVIRVPSGNPQLVRAYQANRIRQPSTPQRTVYSTTEEMLKDPEARSRLLMRAIREATAFKTRYKALNELASVFDAIDSIVEEMVA